MFGDKTIGGGVLLLALILVASLFFIISALIMVTYNNSIVKMNDNFKPIDYNTSMVFVLFVLFLTSLKITFVNYKGNNYKF